MKINFSPPFIDDDILNEVNNVLKSGWITSGVKVVELEKLLNKYINSKKVICVNSWTSGAILVLKWFGVKEGDEVIVPAYTYSATALAVIQCGAKPVMVDVKNDFTIDENKLKSVITEKTKVIIPVDFAGLPCDYDAINRIVIEEKRKFLPNSEKQNLLGRILVMADAAHSIGATYMKKNSGNLTDVTVFSFHAVKNITTAEGGAVSLNLPDNFDIDQEYKTIKLYSLNGQTKDALSKSKAGNWRYDIILAGLKINMPDINAAIGLSQLRKYDALLKERERVALKYQNFFSKYSFFETPILKDDNRKSSFHIYPLRINKCSEEKRDLLIELISKKNVSVNVHFIPMPMLTLFKNLGYKISKYPVSYDNFSREISLPIYPQLVDKQIEFVCKTVLESYKKIFD